MRHSETVSKKKRRPQNKPRPVPPPRSTPAPASASQPTSGQVVPDAPVHIEDLLDVIADGTYDDHLDAIEAAIERRRRDHHRAATHAAATALQIGDRVRFSHDVRPQYLHGATGTITGWAHTNAIVELDAPTGRFAYGQIRCSPVGLQRISA